MVGGFKSITAYHAGDGVWVEVDILLDPQLPIIQAHDIAETLQYCLEGLSEVDRAFVTVDCECRIRAAAILIADQYLIDTSSGPTGHAALEP